MVICNTIKPFSIITESNDLIILEYRQDSHVKSDKIKYSVKTMASDKSNHKLFHIKQNRFVYGTRLIDFIKIDCKPENLFIFSSTSNTFSCISFKYETIRFQAKNCVQS